MNTDPSQLLHIHPSHNLGLPTSPSTLLESSPKPFHLADLARAALASPRQSPWTPSSPIASTSSASSPDWLSTSHRGWNGDMMEDDTESLSSSASSSACSTPASSVPPSPFSTASSCALTPSSSSEGFTLGESLASATATVAPKMLGPEFVSPPSTPPRLIRRVPLRSAPSPSSSISSPRSLASLIPSRAAPAPPSPQPETWSRDGFSLRLFFTSPTSSNPSEASDDDHGLPPAFFPSARISFSPRLRITAPEGVAYAALGGMHLGVTGICETLNPDGSVKTKRLVADFCTDLSAGLGIWKRDGEAGKKMGAHNVPEGRLPPGTYVLPLSMHIPNSDKLPPSFDCPQYRIHYTMSIALFSSTLSSDGTPLQLKVFSIPFHLLPSTLPTPAPQLPVLTHDHKKSVFASLFKSITSPRATTETGYHLVYPSLPTSHFSPASQASIPVTLRIVDRPLEPTDLYVRLSLVRKTYVRESNSTSLATAIEDEWGLGLGVSPSSLGYAEETIIEPWCRSEEEIVSRWGWIPYSSRPGADPTEQAEVLISDIALPLSGLLSESGAWEHGYSTTLDMEPTAMPSLAHGDCSWFSPAFRHGPPTVKEYGKHVHVSSRFFLSVEVGFATPALKETLAALGRQSPDMEIAPPNCFTAPKPPTTSRYSGLSASNPFPPASSRFRSNLPPSSSSSASLPFPGKLRELLIPLTIGSVAEPGMECIATANESSSQRAEREMREERGEDMRREGEGPEGAWMCAPPLYEEALKVAPAYVF